MTDKKAIQLFLGIAEEALAAEAKEMAPLGVKALTLWQPWAQGVAAGLKHYETRSWPTRYRGRLAIHASVRPLDAGAKKLAARFGFENLPLGAIVAEVELLDCVQMTPEFIAAQSATEVAFGDWRVGRWAWKFGAVRALATPIPSKGAQGLWTFHG